MTRARFHQRGFHQRGFSLIELIIVLAIIAGGIALILYRQSKTEEATRVSDEVQSVSFMVSKIKSFFAATGSYETLNYEPRESLCAPGCALGEQLKVPVYTFLKEPIIRRFGEAFYEELDIVAKDYFEAKKSFKP